MTTLTQARPMAGPAGPSRPRRRPGGARRFFARLPVRLLVIVIVAVEILPMIWMLLSSFKTQNEFVTGSVWALPATWDFGNYIEAWVTGDFASNVRNSILATVPALFFLLLFGVAAGFALEVMVWKGRSTILLMFVAGIMIPGQMLLVPLFITYFNLGLTQTIWPLILTYIAMGLPLTVFMMAAYFRAIPREVFEAATIDGAGMIRSFWMIGLPMISNAILTIGLVQFFSIWNDLLVALTFVTNRDLATIQVGLLNFSGEYGAMQYGPLFAAICLNVFGTLAVFLFLSKKIMAGMASGALKG
ncbi:carbohydrate ABC transporter permease [Occultella kanbiaonis]|uniref:carbohydrate ABC transporter permease n=1 Tax=Occultella kanbiaonis TaxID=2675754 RepID=UPI0012B70B2E|nr:carbohydrate ABC transporter permease [Occultella kanbiaonis]